MPRVLVTGVRAPAALEWLRVFGRCGWQVWAADSLAAPLGRWSRYVERYVRLPPPAQDAEGWTMALQRLLDDSAVDVVLPTCEEVFWLAQAAPRLEGRARLLTSPLPLLLQLHHKARFARLTGGWRHQAPPGQELRSPQEALAYARTSAQWVFKPVYSRFAHATLIRPTAAQLAQIDASPTRPWLAQQWVSGTEYCSYSVLHQGRVQAHACYQPRYRVGRGAGIGLQPEVLPQVVQFVEEFGRHTAFTGQVGFDFILQSDGRLWVLECNPRATSGVHLLADQPHELVQALLGERETVLQPRQAPMVMVGLAMLMFGAPRHGARPGFWCDFARARDVVFCSADPAPALLQGLGFAEMLWRATRDGQGLLAASTADIEWNGTCTG